MKLHDKPLTALTAEDLMSREVITVPTGMSLRGAALLLTRAHVSGAPVVDERGQCVGVLSTSDFLKLAGGAAPHSTHRTSCVCAEWQVMELSNVPEDVVQHYMTPDPVTIPPETVLPELARCMLDAHIHRVIVVDSQRRPLGVVSSTDVLAAVASMSCADIHECQGV
jgi:CBS-domain-containing membrane protein